MSPAQSPIRLLVLEGDGIGPEITTATLDVLDAANAALGLQITFEHAEIGLSSLSKHGTTLTDAVVAAAKTADGVILGPVSHNAYPPVDQGGLNPSGGSRLDPGKTWKIEATPSTRASSPSRAIPRPTDERRRSASPSSAS